MEIIRTIDWMKQVARSARDEGRALGFVPTMGALHEGHLSLVRAARDRCGPLVVSIFVNPTQFGPSEDLKKYPRTLDADCAALEKENVEYVFAPTAEEMYPAGFRTWVNVEGLSEKWEGKSRPGHFRGVTTIVLKLFEIVQPRAAFLGRKDAQQLRILQQMARDLNLDVDIVGCPIARAADGLALSSRNAYLNENERRSATALYRSLDAARRAIESGEQSGSRVSEIVRSVLVAESGVAVDYAEVVDAETLDRAEGLRKRCFILLAVVVGTTRLIDNALIEPQADGSLRVTV